MAAGETESADVAVFAGAGLVSAVLPDAEVLEALNMSQ
jgi:isochorismate synthase EntC